ncbi:molecular chaperone [Sedimenticola hydrogenitrophicus]|uniref:fimbrial biogenesis chaperone n=1 Tax=Sedimenticola hydrogenitrophicus TaxID=2967975 RepID=UPI0021A6F003|nr:molecular chaperone [Sedimenticola hydrogenitrophicus]
MKPYRPISHAIRFVVTFALLAWVGATAATGLGVTPIRIHLSEATPTAALTLENNGSNTTVVQLQLMKWDAAGADDHYRPTYEVVATPPIATLQPGQTQIVRVGLSRDVDEGKELAYRLYIEEVPAPPQQHQQGLQVTLRIGVPIFIAPKITAQPGLEWRAVRNGPDSVALHATNVGNAHLRLMDLKLRSEGAEHLLAERQVVGYLLPGQSRQWLMQVEGGLPSGRLRLSAATDPGMADVDLELETP